MNAYDIKFNPEAKAEHDDTKKHGNGFFEEGEAQLRGLAKDAADRRPSRFSINALDSLKTVVDAVQDPTKPLWGLAKRLVKYFRRKPEPDPILVTPLTFVRDGRERAIAVLTYRIDHDEKQLVVVSYGFFLLETER